MLRVAFWSSLVVAAGSVGGECRSLSKKPPPAAAEDPPPVVAAESPPVPPAAPIGEFADASFESVEGKPPYEQARVYESRGQLWMARLILEKRALSPEGTKKEAELLASICNQQGDEPCLAQCGRKLGKKLRLADGGASRSVAAAREHAEPETEAAHARDALLEGRHDVVRSMLEAKVLDGHASKEEIRLLRESCKQQGDRMCVALCDAKMSKAK